MIYEIKNRYSKKMVVVVDGGADNLGLAFVMHGLGGSKEQPHIQAISDILVSNGYTSVRFDATNSLGESDGNFEDATATNYFEDLQDVIAWAAVQSWFKEPFTLVGHSLGGLCVGLYAELNPSRVKALAPLSTVVSGRLSMSCHTRDELANWQATGYREEQSVSKPGVSKRLKWSHMIDRQKYDLLEKVENLTMPVLMIVGDQDDVTPARHQRILFDRLPKKKELHIIKGMSHTPRDADHLTDISAIFNTWLTNL